MKQTPLCTATYPIRNKPKKRNLKYMACSIHQINNIQKFATLCLQYCPSYSEVVAHQYIIG